jgi:hypothetical protein
VAVKVAELPLHMAVGELEAVTVGVGFTIRLTVLVPVHPAPFAPVTV